MDPYRIFQGPVNFFCWQMPGVGWFGRHDFEGSDFTRRVFWSSGGKTGWLQRWMGENTLWSCGSAMNLILLSQWPTFKLLGITYLVGKKGSNFYFMVLWLSKWWIFFTSCEFQQTLAQNGGNSLGFLWRLWPGHVAKILVNGHNSFFPGSQEIPNRDFGIFLQNHENFTILDKNQILWFQIQSIQNNSKQHLYSCTKVIIYIWLELPNHS